MLYLAAGAAMIIAAGVSWHRRQRLAEKDLPTPTPKRKSSLLLGATIIAAELPTAFPYFAAIAAILGVVLLGGREAEDRLTRGREFVQDRWPTVLAGVLLVFGLFVAAVGAGGLI